MNFKSVELSDKEIIDSFLKLNTHPICDYCFTNMFSWKAKFQTEFSIFKETLFVRYFDENENVTCYLMPLGKMDLRDSLAIIIEDAERNHIKFVMKQITPEMYNIINSVMPAIFQSKHDRNNDDYIYFSEKLIKLSGNKLQSKRNFINRFKHDNPQWQYLSLHTKDDIEKCTKMLDKWDNLNFAKAKESLRYDYIATKLMLENFHFLQLKGGAISVNDEIVAFTIGEQLTNDTFVIHVEKAYSNMIGAYTIINQQFAEFEAYKYLYINREDDMGLENLRKAKMSYHPDILLKKSKLFIL